MGFWPWLFPNSGFLPSVPSAQESGGLGPLWTFSGSQVCVLIFSLIRIWIDFISGSTFILYSYPNSFQNKGPDGRWIHRIRTRGTFPRLRILYPHESRSFVHPWGFGLFLDYRFGIQIRNIWVQFGIRVKVPNSVPGSGFVSTCLCMVRSCCSADLFELCSITWPLPLATRDDVVGAAWPTPFSTCAFRRRVSAVLLQPLWPLAIELFRGSVFAVIYGRDNSPRGCQGRP